MDFVTLKREIEELIRTEWNNMCSYCDNVRVQLDGAESASDEIIIAKELQRRASNLLFIHEALNALRNAR